MKITIKSLKQIAYDVTVPSEGTKINELKEILEKMHSFDRNAIKLLFNGTVLEGSKSLNDYGIKEENVLIMMNVKAKPANVIEAKEETKDNKEIKANIEIINNKENKEIEYLNELKILVEMGFPSEESKNCLVSAKGNLSLAIEFIENGIPDDIGEEIISEQNENKEEQNEEEEEEEASPQKLLENMASIVKVLSKNDPSKIQNILISLQQNNPEMIDLITENEEEFKKLVTQPITNEDIIAYKRFQGEDVHTDELISTEKNENNEDEEEEENNNNDANIGNDIRLNKVDYEAVQRLRSLGFNEIDACQAYFAFEKNENMAANFLYESKANDNDEIDCKNV